VAIADQDDARQRAMRRSLLLARIGVVAWALVIVAAIVLGALQQAHWIWMLLAAFGLLRLVMDIRRMRAIVVAIADEDWG
jgi:predicted neutral ceramidase superfamily lipid hydrolase